MQIGSLYIPPPLLMGIVFSLIAAFAMLGYRRRVRHDGQWDLAGKKREAWTDQCTGTSFATKRRVLMPNELGTRRKNFGKPVWSWPITLVVAAMVVIAYFGIQSL